MSHNRVLSARGAQRRGRLPQGLWPIRAQEAQIQGIACLLLLNKVKSFCRWPIILGSILMMTKIIVTPSGWTMPEPNRYLLL